MLNKITEKFWRPESDEVYTTPYLYKRLFSVYVRPYWFRALITTLITLPIGTLDAAIAFALKPYVDGIQLEQSIQNVSYVPFIIVGFTLMQGLLNFASVYLNGWLGVRIMCDLRRDLFKKLQTMEVTFFDTTPSGTIIQGYYKDPEALQANVLNNLKSILIRLSASLSLMAVLISTSWKLSIIAISILMLVMLPSTQIRKRVKNLAHDTNTAMGDILSFYTETVGGIRTIYGYTLSAIRLKKFSQLQQALFGNVIKTTQTQGWLTPSMHIIASVGIALIIWQGSAMVVEGTLTTGGFVSFIAAMLMLYTPIKNLGGSIMITQTSMFAAARIFKRLDQEPAIKDRPNALVLDGIEKGILFDNVTFEYVAGRPILMDFNLTFPRGETTALVGPSGGGKSTVANLIPRFYDVIGGSIRIDGKDVRDITLHSLRKHIAIVMQDNFLFNGTIRDNLRVGKQDATEAEMEAALEKAYLLTFVQGTGTGLDTVVGERGVKLSGGQKQRLAIARAFLKDAPVVILDEATSALDSQSEVVVQKAMEALMTDRTVIIIAHRLSTIVKANRIVVISNGQIAEQGSHHELLAANGAYAALYHSQFAKAPQSTPLLEADVESEPEPVPAI